MHEARDQKAPFARTYSARPRLARETSAGTEADGRDKPGRRESEGRSRAPSSRLLRRVAPRNDKGRLRLLAWNIRQGGGTRLAAIAAALAGHQADAVVLSEYRGGESGMRLRGALAALGYDHVSTPAPPPGGNGVLIAARLPLIEQPAFSAGLPEPHRVVAVEIGGLLLCGVYMPNLLKKVPYWQRLIDGLPPHAGGAALAIGDFNTCRAYLDEAGAIDATAHFMDRIEAIGFCDLWRQRNPQTREFSWYSTRGNGFRIDHAFLSPALAARAQGIRYSHKERLAGISDHSPLIVELGPT